MSRLYALADVLLVHLKDDPLFRITIPHKTLAYLATGKPILAAVSGDVAELVTGEGVGVTCPPVRRRRRSPRPSAGSSDLGPDEQAPDAVPRGLAVAGREIQPTDDHYHKSRPSFRDAAEQRS